VSSAPAPSADPDAADALVVFVTMPDVDTAARIARTLVEEGLVACVNVLPGLRSIYAWQGKICDEAEVLCLIKTRRSGYQRLCERLTALHPYEVPEIIGFVPGEGNAPYLRWIMDSTRA
jgi:periplasmic divalent cation tolerance protein